MLVAVAVESMLAAAERHLELEDKEVGVMLLLVQEMPVQLILAVAVQEDIIPVVTITVVQEAQE